MNPTNDPTNYKLKYGLGVAVALLIVALTVVQQLGGLDALGFHLGAAGTNWVVLVLGVLGAAASLLPRVTATPTAARVAAEHAIKVQNNVDKKQRGFLERK